MKSLYWIFFDQKCEAAESAEDLSVILQWNASGILEVNKKYFFCQHLLRKVQ